MSTLRRLADAVIAFQNNEGDIWAQRMAVLAHELEIKRKTDITASILMNNGWSYNSPTNAIQYGMSLKQGGVPIARIAVGVSSYLLTDGKYVTRNIKINTIAELEEALDLIGIDTMLNT